MCHAVGSIAQATNSCSMCKVFKPSGPKCPHIREICYNRALHPRHDVVYLKNAEVLSFNGCGFCKYARTNPPPKSAGMHNPGWPGCCRPPSTNEYHLISAVDWPAVSIIHHVSVPAEIKSILDSLVLPPMNSRVTASSSASAGSRILPTHSASMPPLDRKNSHTTASNKSHSPVSKSATLMPAKGHAGGSPKQQTSSLNTASLSRATGASASSSVPKPSSPLDQYQSIRRSNKYPEIEKRPEATTSAGRKNPDFDMSIPKRSSSTRRPSVTGISNIFSQVSIADEVPPRRRGSVTGNVPPPPPKNNPTPPRLTDRTNGASVIPRGGPPIKKSPVETSLPPSSASSSSSSEGRRSGGSITDGTVTSDGGFTDYLSDESEAELQRQAEAKAALVAQNQAEELEFKAARQQLAHVDLRPPKSWNATATGGMPRSLVIPGHGMYPHQSFASAMHTRG